MGTHNKYKVGVILILAAKLEIQDQFCFNAQPDPGSGFLLLKCLSGSNSTKYPASAV